MKLEKQELGEKIASLSRRGLDAAMREDWESLETIMREREELVSARADLISAGVMSYIEQTDSQTILALYRKREETRARIRTLKNSKMTRSQNSRYDGTRRGLDMTV